MPQLAPTRLMEKSRSDPTGKEKRRYARRLCNKTAETFDLTNGIEDKEVFGCDGWLGGTMRKTVDI